MPPGVRRAVLAAHLTVSVGWVGAVAAYLALDVVASTGDDPDRLRAAYLGMQVIAGDVIVPLALATFVTGVVISVGTRWGLLRHYWVVMSLLLTGVAVGVLLVEMQTVDHLAAIAADRSSTRAELRALGGTLLHSVGGLVVLVVVLVLNVYKPRGLTPYGWRRQQEEAGRVR